MILPFGLRSTRLSAQCPKNSSLLALSLLTVIQKQEIMTTTNITPAIIFIANIV